MAIIRFLIKHEWKSFLVLILSLFDVPNLFITHIQIKSCKLGPVYIGCVLAAPVFAVAANIHYRVKPRPVMDVVCAFSQISELL